MKYENSILNAYATWSLDENERKTSASGGVASVFYRNILRNKGVIVGTKFDQNMNLVFCMTDKEEDIKKFKGSKYVQAKLGNIYPKVKEKLDENVKTIFIGTPCQVSGLNNYLKKDYANLITVDLICFGTPSQKLFKEHLLEIEKETNEKIAEVKFRGEEGNNFTAYNKKNNKIYKEDEWVDLYYKGYINGMFQNENCYQCKYCNSNRISDITIGDFCGLGNKIPFNYPTEEGVSLVLTNTKKGEDFFDECKKTLFIEKRTIEEAIEGNAPLRKQPKKSERYYKFKKLYGKHGFEKAAKKALREKLSIKIKKYISSSIGFARLIARNIREEIRYFRVIKFNKFPKVKTEFETANDLAKTRKSIARIGDGEVSMMCGASLKFQKYSKEIAERLKEVLNSNEENVLVGFDDVFSYKSLRGVKKNIKKFWKQEIWEKRKIYAHLDYNRCYENACVTRIYMRYKDKTKKVALFSMLKEIWQNEDIVFIEGEKTRLGIGNDLFENAKSIQRIICPNKDAFEKYDEILEAAKKIDKNKTILIALGPTATILAYDLGRLGYRALDVGHLDIEYEWFLKQADKKIVIEGKYVNEAKGGEIVEDVKDDNYINQIIFRIRGD